MKVSTLNFPLASNYFVHFIDKFIPDILDESVGAEQNTVLRR